MVVHRKTEFERILISHQPHTPDGQVHRGRRSIKNDTVLRSQSKEEGEPTINHRIQKAHSHWTVLELEQDRSKEEWSVRVWTKKRKSAAQTPYEEKQRIKDDLPFNKYPKIPSDQKKTNRRNPKGITEYTLGT